MSDSESLKYLVDKANKLAVDSDILLDTELNNVWFTSVILGSQLSDFDLHCLATLAKQYNMVVATDGNWGSQKTLFIGKRNYYLHLAMQTRSEYKEY